MALKAGETSTRIDIVFDVYRDVSIKDYERAAGGEQNGLQLQNITASQIVWQWRTFLSQGGNKTSLIEFLVKEWQKPAYVEKLSGKNLFVTTEDVCYMISAAGTGDVPELE